MTDSRKLWEEIFPEDSEAFLDHYDRVKSGRQWIQTDREDGKLISMIHWNPYRMRVRDREYETRYLVAVATRPEYRHQGRMARLLREGMRRYASEKMPFVWLMPADPAIYRPFDFRYVYEKSEGIWPQADGAIPGYLEVRPLPEEEYGAAAQFLMEELPRHFEIFTCRDIPYLQMLASEVASERGRLMGICEEGRLAGVFSWWTGERTEIREMVCRSDLTTGEGREELIRAVGSSLGREKEITAVTTGWLGERKPIIMARLLRPDVILPQIGAECPREITLRLRDAILPENDGVFRWTLTREGSRWEREPDGREPELALGIAELTEWVFGMRVPAGYEDVWTFRGTFLTEIV